MPPRHRIGVGVVEERAVTMPPFHYAGLKYFFSPRRRNAHFIILQQRAEALLVLCFFFLSLSLSYQSEEGLDIVPLFESLLVVGRIRIHHRCGPHNDFDALAMKALSEDEGNGEIFVFQILLLTYIYTPTPTHIYLYIYPQAPQSSRSRSDTFAHRK